MDTIKDTIKDTTENTTEDIERDELAESKKEYLARHGLRPIQFILPCIYPDCKQEFVATKDLNQHIRSHDEKDSSKCPFCDNAIKCVADLAVHVRNHTEDRPYGCPFPHCAYASKQKANLRHHLRSDIHQLSLYTF